MYAPGQIAAVKVTVPFAAPDLAIPKPGWARFLSHMRHTDRLATQRLRRAFRCNVRLATLHATDEQRATLLALTDAVREGVIDLPVAHDLVSELRRQQQAQRLAAA